MTTTTYTFHDRRKAWDFLRQVEQTKVAAGYPSLQAPYTVQVSTPTETELTLIDDFAAQLDGQPTDLRR